MKKSLAIMLGISLSFMISACTSKQSAEQSTDSQTSFSAAFEAQDSTAESIASINEETSSELSTEPAETEHTEHQKEENPMKQEQFYIIVQSTTFTADFADNESADAFRELLGDGSLTVSMSDYGGFEKVGSIGQSIPRNDTQISTETGDIMLYQGDKIVIFYGSNSWSYSRLGRIDNASAEDLISALGNGDTDITFCLTKPQ
jgi:hypothetical protein